jgi:hypothetical protein
MIYTRLYTQLFSTFIKEFFGADFPSSTLKDSVTRFFASGSLHETVSPQPQSIPLRRFRIFSKIRGDIRSSRFATGDNNTDGKWKRSSIRKILIILFGHL